MKTRIVLIVAAGALITATVTAYYRVAGAPDEPQLATAVVTRGPVLETVEATGTLEAVTTVQVGSQVSGAIKALYADYNSVVRKGQVIAQLEPSLFQTQVEQARATVQRLQADVEGAKVQLEDSRAKLRRAEDLIAKHLIPKTELETAQTTARHAEASLKGAEAQVVQAQASLHQNQVNLGHATIAAPIDGIVISRNVDVGQTVAASMSAPTLFVLAQDLAAMQVSASVDESDVGRIAPGQTVRFAVDAFAGEVFTGTVKQVRLAPVVEQNVVSYITIIDVPNAELKLKPGMTANVTIEVARADGALRVPNAALRFQPTPALLASLGQASEPADPQPGLWVLSQGRLKRVPVKTGITSGTATAVVGGSLEEGDMVVTSAAQPATAAAQVSTGSPLLPQRPGANRNANRTAQGATR